MMSPEDAKRLVTLESVDDQKFEIPLGACTPSKMILNTLGAGGTEDDADDVEFPEKLESVQVLRVNGEALSKVVDFLKHYETEPFKPISTPLGNSFDEVVDQQWYRDFLADGNMVDQMLFHVLAAANYMEIQPLLDLCVVKVTFELEGKDEMQIRKFLKMPKLTKEEEAEAREKHCWIFEEN